jgi:hypothetical protein
MLYFVAVYNTDRAYGGPEEGGWYYNTADLVRVVRTFKNEAAAYEYADRYRARLDARQHRARKPSISSVMSQGWLTAEVWDRVPPEHEPETRPFYE